MKTKKFPISITLIGSFFSYLDLDIETFER